MPPWPARGTPLLPFPLPFQLPGLQLEVLLGNPLPLAYQPPWNPLPALPFHDPLQEPPEFPVVEDRKEWGSEEDPEKPPYV